MTDGKEEGEGEKEFHKCKVGRKTGRVIWQTFEPEGGEAGVEGTFLHSQERGNEEGVGSGERGIVGRGQVGL